jgi:hypothetical protein
LETLLFAIGLVLLGVSAFGLAVAILTGVL